MSADKKRHGEIRDAYEAAFRPTIPVVRPGDEMRPYVMDYLPQDKGARILDAGCGNGSWARHLVDLGYKNLDTVDLLADREIPGARYTVASIDDLPFDDATFDFCLSLSVIYYLEKPSKGFAEISRVLKPGSQFLMTAHTRYSIFSILRMAKRALGLKSVSHLTHSHFESVRAYRRYLEAAGFEIMRVDGYRLLSYSIINRIRAVFGGVSAETPRMTRGLFMRFYKSWFAYHAIIVARKR